MYIFEVSVKFRDIWLYFPVPNFPSTSSSPTPFCLSCIETSKLAEPHLPDSQTGLIDCSVLMGKKKKKREHKCAAHLFGTHCWDCE